VASAAFARVAAALAARGTPLVRGRCACPAHGGEDPNLAVSEGQDGRVLVKCHSHQCTADAIAQALGLTLADLFVETRASGRDVASGGERGNRNGEPTETTRWFDYRDETGALRYRKRRIDRPWLPKGDDGHKEILVFTPDNTSGQGGAPSLLYRLPELIEAIAEERRVYIVEGEPKVEELRARDRAATTSGGAKGWRPEFARYFTGADVVILPDCDAPGRAYAQTVSASLRGIAGRVRIVELPGLPEHGDVVDWFAAGRTMQELEALVDRAEEDRVRFTLLELQQRPELLAMPEVSMPRLVWRARTTMFAGTEKLGKSTLMHNAAASKSTGGLFLGERCEQGIVLMIWLEEHLGDATRALTKFGANGRYVHLVRAIPAETLAARVEQVRRHIAEVRPQLVLIDSLTRWGGALVKDGASSMEMDPIVQALVIIARETDVGLLFSHHARRSDGAYRDSSAIGAAVDMIAELRMPDKQNAPTRRTVELRGRLSARDFAYEFDGDTINLVTGDQVSLDLRIRDLVGVTPGISLSHLRKQIGGRATSIDGAVEHLVARGVLLDRGNGKGHSYFVAVDGQTAESTQVVGGQGLDRVTPSVTANLFTDPLSNASRWGTRAGQGAGHA
jgi:hypothetical protein